MLAVLSAGLFGYSIYFVFQKVSLSAGFVLLSVDAVMIPVLVIVGLKLLAKSPATLRTRLSSKDGVVSQAPELEKYIGLEGIALSDLRPSGTARIEGKRVDVVTRGEYLEKNSAIVVYSVTGNQIIVISKDS